MLDIFAVYGSQQVSRRKQAGRRGQWQCGGGGGGGGGSQTKAVVAVEFAKRLDAQHDHSELLESESVSKHILPSPTCDCSLEPLDSTRKHLNASSEGVLSLHGI